METNDIANFVSGDTTDISLNTVVVEMLKLIKCPNDIIKQGVDNIIKWIKDTYSISNVVFDAVTVSGENLLHIGYIDFITYIVYKNDNEYIHVSRREFLEDSQGEYIRYLNTIYNIHLLYSCAYILTNILNKVDHEDK